MTENNRRENQPTEAEARERRTRSMSNGVTACWRDRCAELRSEKRMRQFVPGGCYLGVVHDDREHLHLHLAVRNEFASGAAIGWVKATIRLMQSMDWVSPETKKEFEVESGRGAGRNSPEFSDVPYPLAALDARKLADMKQEEISEHIKNGRIKVGRVNKLGEITSIEFNGRRIRLRTVRGLAENGRLAS